MSLGQLQKTLFYVFLILLFLLPFEMPISEGVYGVLRGIVGDAYPAFFIGSLLMNISALLLLTSRFNASRLKDGNASNFFQLSIVYVSIGFFPILVSAFLSARVDFAIKQLILGYLAPIIVCFYILMLDEEKQRKAWLALYTGWVVFLAGSMFFLVYYWQVGITQDAAFGSLPFSQRLFMWRYTLSADWNLYSLYIGNANKTSNYLIIFMLLSVRLLREDRISSSRFTMSVFLLFWSLAIITLIILFSRAALFLLPVAIYASGVLKFIRKRTKRLAAAVLLLSVTFTYSAYSDVINYLLFSKTREDDASNALGTMDARFIQWKDIFDYLSDHTQTIAFGMGSGSYGEVFHGDPIVGTHNMFLDVLMEAGMLSLLPLAFLFMLMLLSTLKGTKAGIRDKLSMLTVFVLVLLMTREHSVAYLYATSLGGFCFAVIFYTLTGSPIIRSCSK